MLNTKKRKVILSIILISSLIVCFIIPYRNVKARSDEIYEKLKIFSGRWLIHTTIILILILNFSLAKLYFEKKAIFPSAKGTTISKFENDLKEISSSFSADKDKIDQQLEQIRIVN